MQPVAARPGNGNSWLLAAIIVAVLGFALAGWFLWKWRGATQPPVAVAPVRGVETHQRWDAVRYEDGRAELRLVDDRAMHRGDVATLTPPGDVHNHGHVLGTGPSPYSLILLGDDMYLFERKEYDPGQGTWRTLAPGDPGRPHR